MATITGTNNVDILIGTNGADIIDGLKDKDAMFGGLGNDVYFVENTGDKVYENAGEGIDLVKSTVTYALTDEVENLTLLGIANIDAWGNAKNNVLAGNDGNNWLVGGLGNDTMSGGKGSDTYFVDQAGDKVIESVTNANGGGMDRVESSVDFSLAALANVENLTLVGGAVKATGNALDNTITGNGAANIIDGGKGADTMSGGGNNDKYYVDNMGDKVKEASAEGNDTVISTIALTGAFNNVENYDFKTSAAVLFSGNGLNNDISGGSGNDTIDGGGTGFDSLDGRGGNDTLTGGADVDQIDGGTGADIMKGFGSGDLYLVDNVNDQVIEQMADTGTDTVYASINLTKLFDNVENLYISGKALNGTGNDLDNWIFGNAGNNIMDGGSGKDFMIGGDGNDTYIIDNKGDDASELGGSGIDLVKSSVDFTLDSGLEKLTLTGVANINGTGNGDKNALIGNAGDNVLDGKGGDDIMTGGAGHDTYYVDSKGDKVVETVGNGFDTIYSEVDFSLAVAANVESLRLTGSMAIHATGNAGDNYLYGNTADNDINGGAGADFMAGGKGGDAYHVDNIFDQVIENVGEGIDAVVSTVGLAHGFANVEVYKFVTTQALNFTGSATSDHVTGGSAGDSIDGLDGNDVINGGAGNDALTGGVGSDVLDGGLGADTMHGNLGDDIFVVDNAKDIVSELSNGGHDEVDSSISLEFLFAEVEDLVLVGAANLNGGGNASANTIYGNSGANVLTGRDGADTLVGNGGDDTLNGGKDADSFLFNVSAAGQGHDKVTDFVKGEDVLWFTGVADANNDGNINLNDLLSNVSAIVDHGTGQAVDVAFDNGSTVSFAGAGTGAVNSIDDLVANSATQIHIN